MTVIIKPRFLLLPLVLSISCSAHANLVTNGDFETGDFSGWTPTAPVAAYVSNGGGHTGTYDVMFGGAAGAYDTISQMLATTIGQNYIFSFWLKNPIAGSDSFQAVWNGNTVLDLTPTTTVFDYTFYSYNVTATSATTTISLQSYDATDYFYLDDVSVTANSNAVVPVPSAAALMLLAIAAWQASKKRPTA